VAQNVDVVITIVTDTPDVKQVIPTSAAARRFAISASRPCLIPAPTM